MMMDYNGLCLYCFEHMAEDGTCHGCGGDPFKPVPEDHLQPGTMLRGRFVVGRAVGQDIRGIVYNAYDTQKERTLRIREHFPQGVAQRCPDGAVAPLSGKSGEFTEALNALLDKAEEGEGAKKHAIFEENGTCYIAQKPKNPERAPEPARSDPEMEEEAIEGEKLSKQVLLLGAGIVAVILVIAIVGVSVLRRGVKDSTVVVPTTTDNDSKWTAPPVAEPTPYTTVDPDELEPVVTDNAWQDDEFEDEEPSYVYDDEEDDTYDEFEDEDEDYDDDPVVTRKPSPTPVNDYSKASSAQIKELQWRLIELGWLDSAKPNGKYDKATKNAVKSFQKYVNKHYNADLDEDGIAGRKTILWIEDEDAPVKPTPTPVVTAKPTPEPTAKPTAEPTPEPTTEITPEITPEPEPEYTVEEAIDMLTRLGWLSSGYTDDEFAKAVAGFQNRYAELIDADFPVTGEMDEMTIEILCTIDYSEEWKNTTQSEPNPVYEQRPETEEESEPEYEETTEAEAEPEPEYEEAPVVEYTVENAIAKLQELGWLPYEYSEEDGQLYEAVMGFQLRYAELTGDMEYVATGELDEMTITLLCDLEYSEEWANMPEMN